VARRSVWAVVVGAGSGERFGQAKQFVFLAGRPVVEWAVAACRPAADSVVLVLPPGSSGERFGADVVVTGGSSRGASVRCGLAAVPEEAEAVLVHDAARPLARPELFTRVLAALADGAAGAVCGVPVADTIKRRDPADGSVLATVERRDLVHVQTPQAFVPSVLRKAHAGGGEAGDDAELVERLGATVRVVPGDPMNVKLTTPSDLAYAEHLLGG
jgi:2-C-methyl-D-erythritol 4-phosphate cytidylyltransferase